MGRLWEFRHANVKLVDAATGTDLTGGSVTIHTDGATAGDYKYQGLANPIALEASHSYYLMSQETNGGDQWYNYDTSLTATGDLTVNSADWYDTSYHVGTTGSYGYIPSNFTYGPDQPAITSQSLGTLRNNFTGWAGFKFTTTSGTPVREMNWALDPTGNWSSYLTKTNGTTDLDQTRTANRVNEITAIGGTPNWADPAHDASGNTTTFPQADDPTSSFDALYDAWNRMVQVTDGEDTVATYAYDGRNRRIVQESYTSGSLSETRHFYFTNGWQDIEERLGTSPDTADPERQYVWGIRYVDELVCRDRDTDDDGTLDERLYAFQDANSDLTGICDTSGAVVDRYVFDPYGIRAIRNAAWSGLTSSAYAWVVGHQGLISYPQTGLIYNRNRVLHPFLGTFLSRDFEIAPDLYQYVEGNPIGLRDPIGLAPVTQPSKKNCGPDVSSWFSHELPIFGDPASKAIAIEKKECKDCSVLWALIQGYGVDKTLVKLARKMEYKLSTFSNDSNTCPNTVTLCGLCVGTNQLGNIMFGVIASILEMVPGARAYGRGEHTLARYCGRVGPVQDWRTAPWKESAFDIGVEIGDAMSKGVLDPTKSGAMCDIITRAARHSKVPITNGCEGCAPSTVRFEGPHTDLSTPPKVDESGNIPRPFK